MLTRAIVGLASELLSKVFLLGLKKLKFPSLPFAISRPQPRLLSSRALETTMMRKRVGMGGEEEEEVVLERTGKSIAYS